MAGLTPRVGCASMSGLATIVMGMATATATRRRTTSKTDRSSSSPAPAQAPKRRSPEQSAAILVRMPKLMRQLLHAAAERQGISVNQLVVGLLMPVFCEELEERNRAE